MKIKHVNKLSEEGAKELLILIIRLIARPLLAENRTLESDYTKYFLECAVLEKDRDELKAEVERWKEWGTKRDNDAATANFDLVEARSEVSSLRADLDKAAAVIERKYRELSRMRQEQYTLRSEVERLKAVVNMFKVEGTDGCDTCETGRVSYFKANRQCMKCNPESYEIPKLRGEAPAVEGKL